METAECAVDKVRIIRVLLELHEALFEGLQQLPCFFLECLQGIAVHCHEDSQRVGNPAKESMLRKRSSFAPA